MRNFYSFLFGTWFLLIVSSVSGKLYGQSGDGLAALDSLFAKKQYERAATLLDSVLRKAIAVDDAALIGRSHAGIGNLLLLQGKLDAALENYLISIKHLHADQYAGELSRIYSNMGALYSGLKQFQRSKDYFLKALELNPTENANRLKTLANLAGVYMETNERAEALQTFYAAIQLARQLKNASVEAILYTNLSNYYIGEAQWAETVKYAKQSISLRKGLGQPPSAITYNNLGYALVQLGSLKEGIQYYHVALQQASIAEKKQIYYNLHQAYRALGEEEEAWRAIARYDAVKDSLATSNYEQKVAELEAKYQSAEKERHIEQLAMQNALQEKQLTQQTYLIVAISLIALLIAGIIYLRWKQHRVSDRLSKAEWRHRFLLVQLNPHFIFNAMQSVQHFIHKNERDKSLTYLHSFSRLIRLVLENSEEDAVSLDVEIESLTHYLHLQQLNRNPSFSYHVQVAEELEPDNIWIPTMLLQPFVENAVNHGVEQHGDGRIELLFENNAKGIDIFIKDNGRQVWSTSQAGRLHKSMSMDIVKGRIEQLNKMGRYEIVMNISQSSPVPGYEGTIVHLYIQFLK
ncbi:histidine kinase [Sphingobacterium bambusae]|uniref:Histidine kinase n=1 Tax=Sphingobacterium bambusae TaxID=662858 RepID=A0ABW6BN31_9SPHI|nr:histidine kinase [Sphingobacterium bambusae]WPL49073.1 histidine kinase [Sphingobacterium bambusae]